MSASAHRSAPRAQSEHGASAHGSANLQNFPILIGISGKRTFDAGDAQSDAAVAQALTERFAVLFKALDDDLPGTPKILLTGAAFGSDLIAAEAALARGPQWAVAAILPFDRALFEEDFRTASTDPAWRERHERHAEAFARVLGTPDQPNPRVLVRELPKLKREDGGVTTMNDLSREAAGRDKGLRQNHYEQVGQFIAEIATIMLAVMSPDERAEQERANGGTARIVAYRRAGYPDAAGAAVAKRSTVLRHEWSEVALPPAGYVWLVDPRKADCSGRYPVAVLPPLTDRSVEDVYGGYPGRDLPAEHDGYVGPLRRLHSLARAVWQRLTDDKGTEAVLRRLRGSLVVARGFERMHRETAPASTAPNATAVADPSPLADVSGALNSARSKLSTRQRQVNAIVRRDFHLLAAAFVVAVLLFETYAKLFHDWHWLLGAYLVVLAVIGFQALHGRWKLWEAVAEDYRAVAEALRVQRAWWAAGLDARVDRELLQGADQDLSPIRDCTKMIVGWILLRHGFSEVERPRDWAHVRGKVPAPRDLAKDKKPPSDWVGGQLSYFIKNGEDRERRVQVADAASWCLFVMSGVLATLVWIWRVYPGILTPLDRVGHIRLPWASIGGEDLSFIVWLLLAALVILFRVWNHDVRGAIPQGILTGTFGAAAAVAFALALVNARHHLSHLPPEEAVTYAALASLVVISALAGAYRYLMERLNVEAEALDYRDARGRFERAERLLARGADPKTGTPADEAAARCIVLKLGRLALAENEAWLKSRRERPLTPVVG